MLSLYSRPAATAEIVAKLKKNLTIDVKVRFSIPSQEALLNVQTSKLQTTHFPIFTLCTSY
jgi:hypothetical protein